MTLQQIRALRKALLEITLNLQDEDEALTNLKSKAGLAQYVPINDHETMYVSFCLGDKPRPLEIDKAPFYIDIVIKEKMQ